jgi:signal transduction histidine kinase
MSADGDLVSGTSRTTNLILLGIGATVALVAGFVLVSPARGDVLSIPAGVAAGLAGILAAQRSNGTSRLSWLLLSALPILYAVADTLWLVNADATGTPPILSLADALYVLALAPAVAGLLLYPVLRQLAVQRNPMILDAIVLVLAVTCASHAVALAEVMATAHSLSSGLILVVYPITDGLLVALCLALLLRSAGEIRLDVVFLGLAFGVYLISDTAYALTMIRGLAYDNPWLILGYVVAPLLLAAAALLSALTPAPVVTPRRPLTGVLAPSVPVLTSVGALALAFAMSPRDWSSFVLIGLLLTAIGVRQLVQTSAGQSLRLQLERRVAERGREMAEMAEQYRQLEAMKAGFVSSVSHELRTPLTAIRAALEFLCDDDGIELPPAERSMVDVATRACERLSRLVNDIIDLELLEQHGFGVDVTVSDVRTLLIEASESLAPLARERHVKIVVDASPTKALCDPDRAVQVVVNLIGNALKYAPEESTVTVRAERLHDEVLVSVSDAGCGIPEDHVEAVFNRFHQVSPLGDIGPGGTGLGLAISRGIVDAHHGRIWVDSTLGEGSTFFFTLPSAAPTGGSAPPFPDGNDHASRGTSVERRSG